MRFLTGSDKPMSEYGIGDWLMIAVQVAGMFWLVYFVSRIYTIFTVMPAPNIAMVHALTWMNAMWGVSLFVVIVVGAIKLFSWSKPGSLFWGWFIVAALNSLVAYLPSLAGINVLQWPLLNQWGFHLLALANIFGTLLALIVFRYAGEDGDGKDDEDEGDGLGKSTPAKLLVQWKEWTASPQSPGGGKVTKWESSVLSAIEGAREYLGEDEEVEVKRVLAVAEKILKDPDAIQVALNHPSSGFRAWLGGNGGGHHEEEVEPGRGLFGRKRK